jgi:hypothetical protein
MNILEASFSTNKKHMAQDELKEYYNSEIYEPGMPEFEDLQHWQRSQMQNTAYFQRWQAARSFQALKASILNALRIPQIVDWLHRRFFDGK